MNDHSTKIGTAGGFLTVLLAYFNAADIFKTVIMSAMGTVVSFAVSLLLNYMIRRLRK